MKLLLKLLRTALFFVLLISFNSYSQTLITINGGSPSPDNIISSATNKVITVNFSVSGVQPGMELREVRLKFGNGTSSYSASLEKASVTLSDGSTTIALINSDDIGQSSSSDRKILNFKLRDHSYLNYFASYSTISTGQPFNHGYYRSRGSFTPLKKGTNAILHGP